MVQGYGLITFVFCAASLAASAGGAWISIRFAHRLGLMDVPNERSSHSTPTPRMGGVPMVLAIVLMFSCWTLLTAGESIVFKGLFHTILFAVSMAVIGFWDDLSGLSPLFRFLVQIATAVFLLWVVAARFPEITIIGLAIPKIVCIFVGAIWAVWMLNLYNFMDGIDGLAGGEAAVASSFFFLVFTYYGESGWAVANLIIAAAAMGFLIYNWPPARIFMGDGGSAFLGAFFGMQSLVASVTTPVLFPVLVLPFSNFILDTTITLLRRISRGDKWYHAHRTHYYQRMTRLRMTHRKVTIIELFASAGSCAVAAAYPNFSPLGRVLLVVVILSMFLALGIWIVRRENTDKFASAP